MLTLQRICHCVNTSLNVYLKTGMFHPLLSKHAVESLVSPVHIDVRGHCCAEIRPGFVYEYYSGKTFAAGVL